MPSLRNIGIATISLLIGVSAVGSAADLKPETLDAWRDYIQNVQARLQGSLIARDPFLPADKNAEMSARLQRGDVIVAPACTTPTQVPSGLIHDWTASVFIPGIPVEDVLTVLRSYGEYQQFYKPAVIEAHELEGSDGFSMTFWSRSIMSHTAVEGDYRAVYTKVDEKRWYSIAYTTRIQAIENYRRSDEHKLDVGQGTGYIWRVYTITKFEERDGGVYVEIEAICLSRDVPITLRWLIDPMIRRLSKSSLTSYMASTRNAVRSKSESAARDRNLQNLHTRNPDLEPGVAAVVQK
jgi:hypothetical protein